MLALALGAPRLAASQCTVATQPLAFGVYDPALPAHLDINGQLWIRCPPPIASYRAFLSAGLYSGGSYFPRRMQRPPSDHLDYNIFLRAARDSVWGDGTGGTSYYSGVGGPPGQVPPVPLYGRVFAEQWSAAPGLYSDTITVTVLW